MTSTPVVEVSTDVLARMQAAEAAKPLTQKLSEWWEGQWGGGIGPPPILLWAVPLALGAAVYFLWPRKKRRVRRPGQFFKTPLEPRPGGGYRMKYED